jgi:membrane protein implicated in regulation of membrane protease activity
MPRDGARVSPRGVAVEEARGDTLAPAMGLAYLAALVVGVGLLGVQLVLAAAGDAHAEVHAGAHGHDDSNAAIFLSARFWTYALLAFGMVGVPLHYFDLAPRTGTIVLAILSGLAAGLFASLTFRALRRSGATTTAALEESVGQIGRVILPCAQGKVGKVRVTLKGNAVDALATTDELEIASGRRVVVAEVRGGILHVTTAPEELVA